MCRACGLRLRGPEAQRLWSVDQHLAALSEERRFLIDRLLQPADAVPPLAMPGHVRHPGQPRPSRSAPTGQQLLLGIGALLLLSAAGFVGIVVWMVVGVWGQAVLLVVLTALSVLGANMATRRGLPAAAETGAVLASGLTVIGLWAAWSLNLAGLGELDGFGYAAGAATVAGLLVLGYDRLTPRTAADAAPLRRMLTYRPLATTLLAAATWFLLAAVAPEGIWLVVGLGVVAVLGLLLRLAATRVGLGGVSLVPPLVSALVATVAFACVGLVQAHDFDDPHRKWSAGLMLLSAGALALLARGPGTRGLLGRYVPLTPLAVTALAAPAAWSLAWEAHWAILLVTAVVVALAAIALAWAPLPAGAHETLGHLCAQGAAAVTGAGLVWILFGTHRIDEPQLVNSSGGVGPSLVLVVGVAALWAAVSAAVAVRLRSWLWLAASQGFLVAAVFLALVDATDETRVVTWLVTASVLTAVNTALDVTGFSRRPERRGWNVVIGLGALAAAMPAMFHATIVSEEWFAWTSIVVGVLVYVGSLQPGWLRLGYVAAVLISLGTGLLADQGGFASVEGWSWPLAAVLALVGWRHWRQDHAVRSRLSMGPALSAAYLPSVVAAIGEGYPMRLGLVTAAGVVMLVVGLRLRLQAPVAVAAGGLVLLAITQAGPYVALLPGWLTLGLAGITLLWIGVSWERAVVAGRRGNAWFSTLR